MVVSDGTAVLGLGDIGPAASLPVMEGKSALFKTFGGLDSIPIVLATKDPDEIVETLIRLRPTFGAVNLEDISAPRCFEIERRVIEALDCPVMHDDQHGTAIVVLAALLGASKVLDRDMTALRVVISGAGAAGVACANILLAAGVADITVLDSKGIVHTGRDDLNPFKAELAERTNPNGLTGGMAEALDGADVFMGVSAGLVPEELIATMAPSGIVFAMSNPDPEIHPDIAKKYAAVVATGRSDFPNQINNVLAFPGVFRGALDAGARRITEKMKVAAAEAIHSVVGDDLSVDYIVPSPLDPRVGPAVAAAVAAAVDEDRQLSIRRLGSALLWGLLVVLLAACGGQGEPTASGSMAVGAASDPESVLLANLYAAALRYYGTPAHVEVMADPLAGLDSGQVSVVPGFTGALLQTFQPGARRALRRTGVQGHGRHSARRGVGGGLHHRGRGQAGRRGDRGDRGGLGWPRPDRVGGPLRAGERRRRAGARPHRPRWARASCRPSANSPMTQRFSMRCGRARSRRPGPRRPIRRCPPTWWCSPTASRR